jgi:hypothetical protein
VTAATRARSYDEGRDPPFPRARTLLLLLTAVAVALVNANALLAPSVNRGAEAGRHTPHATQALLVPEWQVVQWGDQWLPTPAPHEQVPI